MKYSPLSKGFRAASVSTLFYTLLVILWGAVVRITGSGAGCGQHWPTCRGEVTPPDQEMETLIEFSHRLTSGLCGLFVLGLVIWAFLGSTKGHPVRKGAIASLFFIFTESAIGAGIVLLEYVEDNASYWRAAWMGVHLLNTFALMASLFITWWSGHTAKRPTLSNANGFRGLWLLGVAGLVIVAITGGVSALGHTLFPAVEGATIVEHVTEDPWADTPYPMLVRVVHPAVSMAVALLLMYIAAFTQEHWGEGARRSYKGLYLFVSVQVLFGLANIFFSAPAWMQITHLALALGVWLALVFVALQVGVSSALTAAGEHA